MEEELKTIKIGVGKVVINENPSRNFYFIHDKNYPIVKKPIKTVFTEEGPMTIEVNAFGPYKEIPEEIFNKLHGIYQRDKTRECFNMIYGIILTYPIKPYKE